MRGHMPPAPASYERADMSVAGPLGRSAGDIAALFEVLAGDPRDVDHPRPALHPARTSKPADLRIAVWLDEPGVPTSEAAAQAVHIAAAALEAEGAMVDHEARPEFRFRDNFNDYFTLLLAIISPRFPGAVRDEMIRTAPDFAADDDSFGALQARGAALSYAQAGEIEGRRVRIKHAWRQFFERFDALLCPVAPVPAFVHSHTVPVSKRSIDVDGAKHPYLDLLMWPSLATHAHLPATVAPSLIGEDGLPAGLQIIGPAYGDRTTLAIAAMLEKVHKGFAPPPGFV